ncbi:membrane protein [Cryobacterium sp. MLB-32]|uniref:DedA family protein n=1 Tax=Cryobacterium sp. MLB-32 TaxID=1529318 RepID=UPI0004E6400D|nr:VTT domain-containing protein [Cryobacterium sp. MLB-32]KFF59105.1 membrane protein [Cryobacterium sp. MLB-32]
MTSPMILSAGVLDPQALITGAGVWGLLLVCAVVFAETGLLIGFFLPGDTLLFFTGILAFGGAISQPLWLVMLLVAVAAAAGDQVGYVIGHRSGPRIFERKESGLFSRRSVERTQAFFARYGPAAVLVARFVPVVRTFAPVAAGVGRMPRRLFTLFNIIGGTVWTVLIVGLGFLLAHIPGVAEFAARYIDLVLVGIVVVSVVPVLVRTLLLHRRRVTEESAQ